VKVNNIYTKKLVGCKTSRGGGAGGKKGEKMRGKRKKKQSAK